MPNCSTIGSSAFYNCKSLTSVNITKIEILNAGAFFGCSKLSSLGGNLSLCTSIGAQAFYNCTELTSISLATLSYLGSSAFWGCSSLARITLLSTSVVPLLNTQTF